MLARNDCRAAPGTAVCAASLKEPLARAADMREGAQQHRAANDIVAGKRAVVLDTLDAPDMMEKEDGCLEWF